MRYTFVFALIATTLLSTKLFSQPTFLDSSFGDNGMVVTALFQPKAMILQLDGKVVIGGNADKGIVARFNIDGTEDTTFGNGGKVDLPTLATVIGIHELPNGQLLVAGQSVPGFSLPGGEVYKFAFVKLEPNGTISQSLSITHGANGRDNPQKMKVLPDGKILVVGGYGRYNLSLGRWYHGGMIARYNSNLSLDTTFNGTGYKSIFQTAAFQCVSVLENGSILAGMNFGGDIRLYGFTADGVLDNQLSDGGMTVIDIGSADDRIRDIKVLSDDRLLISGSRSNGSHHAVLSRLHPSGTIDNSYGDSGLFVLPNSSTNNEEVRESILLGDGKILSSLQRWNNDFDYGLMFTTTDGNLDTASGNNGQIVSSMEGTQRLNCMLQQPDGKIVVAGYDENNMIMLRYDISTALNIKHNTKSTFTVYPNPSTGKIVISGLPDYSVVSVYNISGQKLSEQSLTNNATIDLGEFPKGLYFLKSQYGSVKIIKN